MVKRDFIEWLSGFRPSIADYGFYINFDKVYRNVDDIKIELNILNSLIGSHNIEEEFRCILSRYPEVLQCIPILLAVRASEIYCQDDRGGILFNFNHKKFSLSTEDDLDKYVYFIIKAGFIKGVNYFKEMYIHEITEKWGIDLFAISNQGTTEKRFDFVVKTDNMIYVIETNFYSGGGSKLNETARSYKTLALESNTIDEITFVWFTDGKGWNSAKNNLKETFDVMEHIYNIKDLENNIISEVFK